MNKLANYVHKTETYLAEYVYEILLECNRDEVIAFLAWNDRNGIYMDADCLAEGLPILGETEAKLLAMKILWESGWPTIKTATPTELLNELKERGYEAVLRQVIGRNHE